MQIGLKLLQKVLAALAAGFVLALAAITIRGSVPPVTPQPSAETVKHVPRVNWHSASFLAQKTESGGGEKKPGCGDKKKLNDELKEELDPGHTGRAIRIAPMVTQGNPTAGTYTDVDGGIWDAVVKRSGIKPCESDPKDLKGHEGYLEYVGDSNVLNNGGTRTTFGYFVWNGAEGALSADYFLLFSYDRIKDPKTGKITCAFEVFKFGPFPHTRKDGEIHPDADPPEWVFGYAVNADGCLVPEVPPELARVFNFLGGDKNETVKPGVEEPKEGEQPKGCRKCHDRSSELPSSTLPFPWVSKKEYDKEKQEEKKVEKKEEPKEEERPRRVGRADTPGTPGGKSEGENVGLPGTPVNTTVGLILPGDARPDDTMTGSVVTNPQDYRNNPALRVIETTLPLIKTASGPSLSGVDVSIGGGPPQAADLPVVSRATPGASVPMTFTREGSGVPIGQVSIPAPAANLQTGWAGPAGIYQTSHLYQQGGTVEIGGPFNGNASRTQVQFGVCDARVIAGSPRTRYLHVPADCAVGRTELVLKDGVRQVRFPVSVLSLEMSADKLQLMRGESTRYHVVISGLDSLPDSAWREGGSRTSLSEIKQAAPQFRFAKPGEEGTVVLLLRNLSPQVVTMDRASNGVIAVTIRKSDVHDGKFRMDGTLQSKVAGGFVISGRIVSLLAPSVGERQPSIVATGQIRR
jgi:hypothetical protein